MVKRNEDWVRSYNMADEKRGIIVRKLENLCAALISENIDYWKPEAFLGKKLVFHI